MVEKKITTGTSGGGSTAPHRRQAASGGQASSWAESEANFRSGFKDEGVDLGVEKICNKGCQAVRKNLAAMERGEILPELKKLTPGQRREVYQQLHSIMAVYGDTCRLS